MPRPQWDPAERVLTVFLPKGGDGGRAAQQLRRRPTTSSCMGAVAVAARVRGHRCDRSARSPAHLRAGQPVDLHRPRPAARGRGRPLDAHSADAAHPRARRAAADRPAGVRRAQRRPQRRRPARTACRPIACRGRTRPQELAPITAVARRPRRDVRLPVGRAAHPRRQHGQGRTWWPSGTTRWTCRRRRRRRRPAQLQRRRSTSCRCRDCAKDTCRARQAERGASATTTRRTTRSPWCGSGDRAGPGRDRASSTSGTPRRATSSATPGAMSCGTRAVATSRYREYFRTRTSTSRAAASRCVVDVPASARPLAPAVVYVVPTFGWQRQGDTNMKRSVRFGGGLRVYLSRPWFSSGAGELLGVALWNGANGPLERRHTATSSSRIHAMGHGPDLEDGVLAGAPEIRHFPDAVASDVQRLPRGGERAHLRRRARAGGRRRVRAAVRHRAAGCGSPI